MNTTWTIVLFVGLIVAILTYNVYCSSSQESFTLGKTYGVYPSSEEDVLVQDTYPITGDGYISNNSASTIWQDYPVFPVGSYAQITNNIRYPDSPDNGRCMPASMCGALYKDKEIGNNYVTPPPPAPDCEGETRVNYYSTLPNLVLPFINNHTNILY